MSLPRPRKPRGGTRSVPVAENVQTEGTEVREGILVDKWFSCYSQGWPKELLVPDAFAHP